MHGCGYSENRYKVRKPDLFELEIYRQIDIYVAYVHEKIKREDIMMFREIVEYILENIPAKFCISPRRVFYLSVDLPNLYDHAGILSDI